MVCVGKSEIRQINITALKGHRETTCIDHNKTMSIYLCLSAKFIVQPQQTKNSIHYRWPVTPCLAR